MDACISNCCTSSLVISLPFRLVVCSPQTLWGADGGADTLATFSSSRDATATSRGPPSLACTPETNIPSYGMEWNGMEVLILSAESVGSHGPYCLLIISTFRVFVCLVGVHLLASVSATDLFPFGPIHSIYIYIKIFSYYRSSASNLARSPPLRR